MRWAFMGSNEVPAAPRSPLGDQGNDVPNALSAPVAGGAGEHSLALCSNSEREQRDTGTILTI